MSGYENIKTNYWLNICLVVPALLMAGATMALMYFLVPRLFVFSVAIYLLKFGFELRLWQKTSLDERRKYDSPFRLMNYNIVLSAKMEWLLFSAAFLALVLWIEYAQFANG